MSQINANIDSETNEIVNRSYERAVDMLDSVNKVKFRESLNIITNINNIII